jgi:hypothetical protein
MVDRRTFRIHTEAQPATPTFRYQMCCCYVVTQNRDLGCSDALVTRTHHEIDFRKRFHLSKSIFECMIAHDQLPLTWALDLVRRGTPRCLLGPPACPYIDAPPQAAAG